MYIHIYIYTYIYIHTYIYIYIHGKNTQTKHIERLCFLVTITSWCPKLAAKNPPVLSQASSRAASRSCSGPGSPRAMARRKRSFALKVSTSSGFFNLSTWEVGGVTKGYTLPVRLLIVQYQYSCNNHTIKPVVPHKAVAEVSKIGNL